MRILALGDSYTCGEGVLPAERWPMQLAERLRERGLDVAEPVIVAQTGWRADELSAVIEEAALYGPFDLVTLLIGVNNQYQGRGVAEYREQFRAVLRQAIGLANAQPARVLVLSIPDWGVTPFAEGQDRQEIDAQIDAFNQINRAESETAGARYVDITPITRQKGGENGWLAGDDLHPSGKMYALWVEQALPLAAAAIGSGWHAAR